MPIFYAKMHRPFWHELFEIMHGLFMQPKALLNIRLNSISHFGFVYTFTSNTNFEQIDQQLILINRKFSLKPLRDLAWILTNSTASGTASPQLIGCYSHTTPIPFIMI